MTSDQEIQQMLEILDNSAEKSVVVVRMAPDQMRVSTINFKLILKFFSRCL